MSPLHPPSLLFEICYSTFSSPSWWVTPRFFYKAVVFGVCLVSCVFQNLLRSSRAFKAASMWVFQCGRKTHVHIWGASQISSPLGVAYFYNQLGHFIRVFQKDTLIHTLRHSGNVLSFDGPQAHFVGCADICLCEAGASFLYVFSMC